MKKERTTLTLSPDTWETLMLIKIKHKLRTLEDVLLLLLKKNGKN